MAADYELTLNDYLSIFKRRWGQMLAAFLLILLAGIAAAILLPAVYESKGTILVESQRVPTDLVKATVTSYADERIEVIKQRVMTRDNLYRIIQKYHLYPDDIDKKSTSMLIDNMRKSLTVELLDAEVKGGSEAKTTIAFDVGFEYAKPDLAHSVANEVVTLFLDENVKARTERATETTEFLTQEVDALKKELETVENKVATYKQEHENSLPEHMEMHMGMLQRADSEIKELDRDYKSTQEELRYLDVELVSAKASAKVDPEDGKSGVSELESKKAELERSLIIYKESHPTIRALKRQIEKLEGEDGGGKKRLTKTDVEVDLLIAKIQAQIEAAKVRLTSITEQKKSTEEKISQLQTQVSQSPQVERGLFTLMRDYENAKNKYEEVKSKQVNAKIAENLESENKAERFSLLEPPIFPDVPIKPNRKKIIGLAIFGAIAGALALAALLEMLDKRVRGVESLTAVIGLRPLVVVPYIATNTETKRKKNIAKYSLIAGTLGIILVLLLVHILYQPLDLLLVKIMTKFAT